MKQNLIFVITDGIQNTVFESQVIVPLLKKKDEFNITLVSFEKETSSEYFEQIKKKYSNIQFVIFSKNLFFTKLSLLPSVFKLKNFLKKFDSYHLTARGPISGYISSKAADHNCQNLIIQARGLLGQEYFYIHRNKNFLQRAFHFLRARSYHNLEKCVYHKKNNSMVEAVTPALKDFIISNYKARPEKINISHEDIPEKIVPEKIKENRLIIRNKLNIAHDAQVYCYNGSAHPWQCPEQMIEFFKQKLAVNSDSFLLILSQNTLFFENLAKKNNLPLDKFSVLKLEHNQINEYLCAADFGLIFRENHIINWVSRPTKVLEYQAAGLRIIHNNTVKWIRDNWNQF